MAPITKKKKQAVKMDNNNSSSDNPPVISGQLEKQIENRKNKGKKSRGRPERGVLFIKNLPHGFFEAQIKQYFKQFGKVTNLRLVRSRKMGTSKGYAYVEFEVPEVAQVVAETMNNYIMFQKLLKAAYIPPEEQKFNYFKSTVKMIKNSIGKKKFVSNATRRTMRQLKRHNNWDEETYTKRTKQTLKKLNKMKKKYAHLGINFDDLTVKPSGILEFNDSNSMKSESNNSDDSIKTETENDEENNKKTKKSQVIKKRKASPVEIADPKSKKSKNKKTDNQEFKEHLETSFKDKDSSNENFIPIHNLDENNKKNSKKKSKANEDGPQLKDLLSNELEDDEDSSDEDFTPTEEQDVEDENLGLNESDEISEFDLTEELEDLKAENEYNDNEDDNDDDNDDNDDDDDNDDNDDDDDNENQTVRENFIKAPKKLVKMDTFEKLTKRKPQLGAIQKGNKKSKKSKIGNNKEKLKLIAAKEIVKTQKSQHIKHLKKNKKTKV